MAAPNHRIRKVAALLNEGPLSRAELVTRARETFPRQPDVVLAALIDAALEHSAIVEHGGLLQVPGTVRRLASPGPAGAVTRPLRAVAIDVESVVRTTDRDPYLERRIFQVGAVRFGADQQWVAGSGPFTRWVALPSDQEWHIPSEAMAEQHARQTRPPSEAFGDLLAFVDGADVMVAYNGTDADFPMLNDALQRVELPGLPGHYIDGFYLALALWPTASSHRLAALAEEVGVDTTDLSWHDATDDAQLLRRLIEAGAAVAAAWPDELAGLLASVCPDSLAWQLVRDLAAAESAPIGRRRTYSHADVANLTCNLLNGHMPRRPGSGQPSPGSAPIAVPASVLDAEGRVSVAALAQAARGERARRRPAQEDMTAALQRWTASGTPGAVEAPTGTGKSYAVLAAALDWLDRDVRHTAIITTYTKQLQGQLADDLARLADTIPTLARASDVVKGAANRLSLRALMVTLSEATGLDEATLSRAGGSQRFLPDVRFRELLIYLLLRLKAANSPVRAWSAFSVDPVDVPMFFVDYIGPALPAWLAALSQANAGDYPADTGRPISLHTSTVNEAFSGRRLILANHALLLAHLDQLDALGEHTVLVVDEAHELENSATSALTTTFDYRALENLCAELQAWVREAGGGPTVAAAREAIVGLESRLDHENIPKVVSQAFDAKAAGSPVGSRTVTLAGPYDGVAGTGRVRTLSTLLKHVAGLCEAVAATLGAHRDRAGLDFYARERLSALISLTLAQRGAAQIITADLDELLGRDQPGTAPTGSKVGDQPSEDSQEDDGDEEDGRADSALAFDVEPLPDTGQTAAATGGRGMLPPGTPNRVVYAEELGLLRGEMRRYRFRVATAPIELPEDGQWRRFLAAFRRYYLVSATLRVHDQGGDDWAYLRSRLGLPTRLQTLHLESPFDLADQVELVCLQDFPSWAEQTEGAVRTVAHQLCGYAREMIQHRGHGHAGGALVLTTARSTAGGIADQLAVELRRAGHQAPVRAALVRGNRQSVAEFTDPDYGGGILVGTKGLWQGVDVPDPQQLRLVWINKLPFLPFGDPVIQARMGALAARSESAGADDPEAVARDAYYLPMAALQLRQAVGRLIRSEHHRGVVVISDRKLSGASALRRTYRQVFLGSLDPQILRIDPLTGEVGAGNVATMIDAWQRIWQFFARHRLLDTDRADLLCTPEALTEHVLLPQTRRIAALELSREEASKLRDAGELADEAVRRASAVAGLLKLQDDPLPLKAAQEAAIRAVADGHDLLGLLPTGFGKSYCFQLPALVLPGVTLVVSPLIALMHDQALELNRSVGGAVRALVGPMRESNSRAGRTEVHDQLLGRHDHQIKIIYVSPERLCQTRMRELVRGAVAAGIINRITIDEAHTAIQWGDDFRPSFRRLETFLTQLRRDYGLPITAVTATANHTVRSGLRQRLFGLASDDTGNAGPSGRTAEAGGRPGELVTVQENPIRPELAIYRRTIRNAGPAKVAALIEHVVRTLDGHAIFYCLTVKEVVAVHAHLRDHFGDGRVTVRRFHGRLTEVEKAAVMTEFREAPRAGDDGFVPLLVVATSAFGLGVDRPDVRTVFCVSPPTDLAALYQQIGRAGRDGEAGNAGLALATGRGLRTVQFMTSRTDSTRLLWSMAQSVLSCQDGILDPRVTADQLIAARLAARQISADTARDSRTHDDYAQGIVRVFAALADHGVVQDLGDFPARLAIQPGGLPLVHTGGSEPQDGVDEVERRLIDHILTLPAADGPLPRAALPVGDLHTHLAALIPGYLAVIPHPPALWEGLSDLHDRGLLDVSAAPARRFLTGLKITGTRLPSGFFDSLDQAGKRAVYELQQLRSFFEDTSTCANRRFADYFGVPDLPEGCCCTAQNRCSACWDHRLDIPRGQIPPPARNAFATPAARLTASGEGDAGPRARLLDRQVLALLGQAWGGMSADHVRLALRGEDSWFHATRRKRITLPLRITSSRYFGAAPRVTTTAVTASLQRLQDDGRAVLERGYWRDAAQAARQAARRERQRP